MGVLDELTPKRNQIVILHEWLEAQPKKDREEWLEALRKPDVYPTAAIFRLMVKRGLEGVEENAVIRYRRKLPGYVSSR